MHSLPGWRVLIGAWPLGVLFSVSALWGQAPTLAVDYDGRGVASAQAGDLTGAIEQFKQALRLDPNFAPAHYHLALAFERQGQTDAAIHSLLEALRQNPGFVEARYILAECCAKRGDFDGELRLLADVVAHEPGFAEARYNYGLALQRLVRSQDAITQLTAAAALNPKNPKISLALGIALAGQDPKKAVTVLRDVIKLSPGNPSAHYNLALALAADGNDDAAVTEFTAALSLNPNHASARRGLGICLMHQGKLDDAAGELQRVLKIAPQDAEAANNLGMVELRRKNIPEAIRWLQQAIHSSPLLIKAHFNLAQAYQRAGRTHDARQESDRAAELTALERSRGQAMVLSQAAEQALKTGDTAAALHRLREAISVDGTFPVARLRLGTVLRESGGDFAEAIETLRYALRLDPESAEAHYQIGLALEATGKDPAAFEEFRAAVEMAPCHPEMLQAFGNAALKAGRWAEAATEFRRVLAWRPDDRDVRLALDRAISGASRVKSP